MFLEFPPAPLESGHRIVQHDDLPRLDSPRGPLHVITPTLCVMDRLSVYWYRRDRQSRDQAVMVAGRCDVDYDDLAVFAREEGADPRDIERLREQAGR